MLTGNLKNLKTSQLNRLEKLINKKSNSNSIISYELSKSVGEISKEISRQVGVLVDRFNVVQFVIVGTNKEIVIPVLKKWGISPGKLRGLRLLHTHLYSEDFNEDDLTDLALLRLDSISVLHIDDSGEPVKIKTVYLMPTNPDNKMYGILEETSIHNQKVVYKDFIEALESEIYEKANSIKKNKSIPSAILVGIYRNKKEADEKMSELKEIASSAMIEVLTDFKQVKNKIDPKYVIGSGKLREIIITAMQLSADYVIFDNELTPTQAKNISEIAEVKILDRAQLILDIFARRAKSNEGKLRVELAQMKYILPRLSVRDDSLSRLTGGIGGRGPGETKLEIDKRRINEKIVFLSQKLKEIEKNRSVQKKQRTKNSLPVVSIIGYTNAGKSTLLNALTNSDVYADNLMFATLDTSSKRIRFPREREVIITDTVGFIRDLPEGLKGAFKSTLEELEESDMLLHVIDISDSDYERKITAVNAILSELSLENKKNILVFNKTDLIEDDEIENLRSLYPNAIFISALKKETFKNLLETMELELFREGKDVRLTI